ncbi:MAG TPA: ParA family protein [Acidobacteriota bacterium]
MPITAILSMKGGTGKTTTACNLGAALAERGRKVLLVDLDPQGSLTYIFRDRIAAGKTMADLLLRDAEMPQVVQPVGAGKLFLLPADIDLLSVELRDRSRRLATRLRDHLRGARRRYDHILIDGPPSLDALAVQALIAADHVLVPIQAAPLAHHALELFARELELLRRQKLHAADILGIVFTQFNPYLKLTAEVVGQVRSAFRDLVLRSVIRSNVRLAEAPLEGKTIFEYRPQSLGADCYRQLRKEFQRRLP